MPVLLMGNTGRIPAKNMSLDRRDISYQYPMRLKMKPGSELHERVRTEILRRAMTSKTAMSARYESWNEIDKKLTVYIPLDEEEKRLKEKDPRRPMSIVMPLSYGAMETLLTYMITAFFDEPIFKFDGVGSEDVLGAALLERVIDVQARRAKMPIQLHTMFRDAFAYGFGVVSPVWNVKRGYATRAKEDTFFSSVINSLMSKGFSKERQRVIKFEGNELYNVDPYSYLPDVSVPIQDVQRGEYVGWHRTENYMEILSRESDIPGESDFFNGRYLEGLTSGWSTITDDSMRDKYGVQGEMGASSGGRPMDVIYMYVNLIPAEWGLGRKTYPEKWKFALAADQVVICAMPLNLDHDMFPLGVCAPDYDGYGATPISKMETVFGLQTLIDFLYNSHVANVRKAVNDMFVVDPELVNVNDLKYPTPGKIIRLRRKAWGRGVKDAVSQLAVSDVTMNNITEGTILSRILDEALGVPDSLKGVQRRGSERISASEFQSTHTAALSKLEKAARMGSLMALSDVAYMLASQTQQFMQQEQYVKIIGRYEDELREEFGDVKRILADPFSILVDYDVLFLDGTVKGSGDAQLWAQIFQTISGNELLAGRFNVVNIFKHVARLAGARNIQDFVLQQGATPQIKTMPDDAVAQGAARGDLIPLEGAGR